MNMEPIMNTPTLPRTGLHRSVALAALALGGMLAAPAWAAPPAAPAPAKAPAVVDQDVTMYHMAPGITYLNGGVGQLSEERMRKDARHWPLRMTFSDRPGNEFVAGVQLKVLDHTGHAVLRLKDAGPMTYVQLPPGDYRITAAYKGDTLTREVHIGPKGMDANFHWKA